MVFLRMKQTLTYSKAVPQRTGQSLVGRTKIHITHAKDRRGKDYFMSHTGEDHIAQCSEKAPVLGSRERSREL